jgi:hypothetical protein
MSKLFSASMVRMMTATIRNGAIIGSVMKRKR